MFCKFEQQKNMIMGITFHWTNNLRQRRYYKGFNHIKTWYNITDSPHIRIFTWQFYCDLKIMSHFICWIVFVLFSEFHGVEIQEATTCHYNGLNRHHSRSEFYSQPMLSSLSLQDQREAQVIRSHSQQVTVDLDHELRWISLDYLFRTRVKTFSKYSLGHWHFWRRFEMRRKEFCLILLMFTNTT